MRFRDQVAVVTGATSGIGRSTALAFAAEGASVAVVGRRKDRLEALAGEVRATGVRALVLEGDARQETVCERWASECERDFGRVDHLVNAAGVLGMGSSLTTPTVEWRRQMDTNVDGVFFLTRAFAELLKKGRGASVVNLSSVTGYRPYANLAAYCVSKAAVEMLTKCQALDFAPFGVRVNALCPGVVVTELHTVTSAVEDYPAFLERSKATHPLGRVGQPDEIAAAVLYLCSREAGWITGACMPIDGGRGLMSAR